MVDIGEQTIQQSLYNRINPYLFINNHE
jgi:hypothetical protein